MTPVFRSSQPDQSVRPRPNTDPSRRRDAYGKIQPMPHDGRDVLRHVVFPALVVVALFVVVIFAIAAL